MRNYLLTIPLICIYLATGALAQQAPAVNPQAFGSDDTCVLLANSQLLTGYVIRSETAYRVQLANGAAVTIPTSEVELHCRSAKEAFDHLQRNTDISDLSQQIALSRWCSKYALYDEAVRQLEYARLLGGDRKQLASLRRENDTRRARASKSAHRIVSHETVEKPQPARKLISAIELQQVVRALPENGFKFFANDIQSRLINSCAASGCHNDSQQAMPLTFVNRGRAVTRRMSEHNLYHVLEQVDRSSPNDSPILKMAVTPHGQTATGRAGAKFWGPNSVHFKYLQAWVHIVADGDARVSLANAQSNAQSNTAPNLAENHPNVDPQAFKTNPSLPAPPVPVDPLKVDSFRPLSSTDPFDPEVFNREFGPDSSDSSDSSEPKQLDEEAEIPTLPGFTGFPK